MDDEMRVERVPGPYVSPRVIEYERRLNAELERLVTPETLERIRAAELRLLSTGADPSEPPLLWEGDQA